MINKSFEDLVGELLAPTNSNHNIGVQLLETGGKCSWCKKRIKRKHKFWEWRFDGIILKMHIKCFLHWFGAVVPDAEKAADLTGE